MTPRVPTRRQGFSLIELMVTLVIIGILAAIVVPRFTVGSDNAKQATAAQITHTVQLKIAEHLAKTSIYPTDIDPNWFASGALPPNPFDPAGGNTLITQNIPGKVFLQNKTSASNSQIYWYNRATGTFHIRIPDQGSDAANLALYNLVNHANAQSMSQQTP